MNTCSADTPVRERLEARVRRAKPNVIFAAIMRLFTVLGAVLQEVFDESAYQRFLDRNRMVSSPSAYASFRQENEQTQSRRPRCC